MHLSIDAGVRQLYSSEDFGLYNVAKGEIIKNHYVTFCELTFRTAVNSTLLLLKGFFVDSKELSF